MPVSYFKPALSMSILQSLWWQSKEYLDDNCSAATNTQAHYTIFFHNFLSPGAERFEPHESIEYCALKKMQPIVGIPTLPFT
jgi:hypothetical protein